MEVFVRRRRGEGWSWRCGELGGEAKLPFISAARALLKVGTDPTTQLELYHEGSKTLCLTGTLDRLAHSSVDQDSMKFRQLTVEQADQLGLPSRGRPIGPANRG